MSKSQAKEKIKWSAGSRQQKPLRVGHEVAIQNLAGNYPLKWDRTGLVIEVLGNDQYQVKVDGTGRVTLRNRKHLKPIGYKEPADPFPMVTAPTISPSRVGGEDRKNEEVVPHPQENTKSSTSPVPVTPRAAKPIPVTPQVMTPKPVMTPKSADSSLEKSIYLTPKAESTPIRTPVRSRPVRESPPPTTPVPLRITPVMKPTRVAEKFPVPSPVKVHPELRSHNRPGLKEPTINLNEPRQTRSGKQLGS